MFLTVAYVNGQLKMGSINKLYADSSHKTEFGLILTLNTD